MIIRVFRVRIKPELRDEFEKTFFEVSVPLLKAQRGMLSVTVGRPTRWTPDEYVATSVWENEDAIARFVGEKWNQGVIPTAMKRYVEESWVHHYKDWPLS